MILLALIWPITLDLFGTDEEDKFTTEDAKFQDDRIETEDIEPISVIFDRITKDTCHYDEVAVVDGELDVGNIESPGWCPAEVAAFGFDKGMSLIPRTDAWTDLPGDVLTIDALPDPVTLPVTVWVLEEGDAARAKDAMIYTELAFLQAKAGFTLDVKYEDATKNQPLRDYLAENMNWLGSICDNNNTPEAHLERLANRGLFHDGRINLYRSSDLNKAGVACNDGYRFASIIRPIQFPSTTAHEIGHLLSLGHVDATSGLDDDNLMWTQTADKAGRYDFTLGQVYRMNTDPRSFAVAHGYSTLAERDCYCESETACPSTVLCPGIAIDD